MRPGRFALLALVLGVLALRAPLARSDGADASVTSLVETLRYDPESPTAAVVLERLGREGEKGWKALASLAIELWDAEPHLAAEAARLLASSDEPERMVQAARAYDRLEDVGLRRLLAIGLAKIYPLGAERLHAQLATDPEGSLDLLRLLVAKGMPREVLEAATEQEALAGLATSLLQGRKQSAAELDLLPRARKTARLGLDPKATALFLAEFQADPYLPLLSALAEILREDDPDAATGAHCLLLTVSGMDLGPDAGLWHSWISGREGDFVPPDPVSKGPIAAAVRRGARHLTMDLAADGVCYPAYSHSRDAAMGATALAVLALRASGVPADDPAIVKAIETTMLVFDRGGRPGLKAFPNRFETYSLALLAMALRRLGKERMQDALVAVRDRLANGVLENGQWTYPCLSGTAANRPASGDNSNTQYANLGLRALRASGIELPAALWDRVDAHWRGTQQADGVWGYTIGGRDGRRGPVQMTASGIAGLAIAHEGREGARAAESIGKDESILKGLRWMGRNLLLTDFHLLTPYTLYAVERACVLTGARAFAGGGRTLDWYREGASRFLRSQNADGSWGHPSVRHWESQGFGKVPSTAFALLFLTKSTATVGDGVGEQVVAVSVTPEEVATPPPNRAPKANADASTPRAVPWQKPAASAAHFVGLRLESRSLATRTGKAVIRGELTGPWARLEVAGAPVQPGASGRFEAEVEVSRSGPVELVAYGPGGRETRRSVHVEMDTTPPSVALNGASVRHVGTQRLLLEADETLDGVRVGRYFFPADDRKVWVTAELGEHMNKLVVNAFDRAGNRTRQALPLEIVNRVLVLDGASAVRIALPEKPEHFTLECWARSPPVDRHRWIAADAEYAGMGFLFTPGDGPVPGMGFHTGKEWVAAYAKKPVKKDRWTHLALTYDGAHARLWVNGKTVAEIEAPTYRRSGRALLVGAEPDRHNNPRSPLIGAIDEVRLSSVCRYQKTFQPAFSHAADKHTVVLLHFDTDTEKAILDDSGRHHHGTPVGAPKIVPEKR